MTSTPKRAYWFSSRLGVDYDPAEDEDRHITTKDNANLIGSFVEGTGHAPAASTALHMPALDIDFPCHIRESETPGHYHLLIDVPMSWEKYAKLLLVMEEVGILEPGYVKASLERGCTFLARAPWKETHGKAS